MIPIIVYSKLCFINSFIISNFSSKGISLSIAVWTILLYSGVSDGPLLNSNVDHWKK